MQDAVWVAANSALLLAPVQLPLIKFEAYINGSWLNFNDLLVERLADGGLEDWASPTNLTDWTEIISATGTVNREATTVHSGIYSCRLYTPGGGEYAGIKQTIALTSLNSCKVSIWYYREVHVGTELRLFVQDQDPGPNISLKSDGTWQAAPTYTVLATTGAWTYFELSFLAHADYSSYVIRILKDQSAGAASSFYIDDISVSEVKAPALGVWEGGNYLQSAGISLGGASMTPNPVAGKWNATLFNENGVFHPQHPTSPLSDYLKTERLVRISVGATYATDKIWQRIIGYMSVPKFSTPDYRVAISGGDYMKRLRDTELRHLSNYWGTSWTTSSISSDGAAGVEKYINPDPMRTTGGGGEDNTNPPNNWVPDDCAFTTIADIHGGSTWVGKMVTTEVEPFIPTVVLDPVFVPLPNMLYAFKFKYNREGGTGASLRVIVKQKPAGADWIDLGLVEELYHIADFDAIIAVTQGGAGAGDFGVAGDLTARYEEAESVQVIGSTGNDGIYTVSAGGSVFAAGVTTIPVDEAVPNAVADGEIIPTKDTWPEVILYFTTETNDAIEIWLEIYDSPLGTEYRFDEFSIFEFVPYWKRYYDLRAHDANEKGVHHITIDPTTGAEDVWQGEVDEGWYYAEDAEAGPEPPAHPAGIVFFDPNKTVAVGANNLIIYYYTATAPEDAVARILYMAGVFDPSTNAPYVDEPAAKTAMVAAPGYAATGITIDKIWFEPGTTGLAAIKMLCERGDAELGAGGPYVFYFTFDGQPVFKPKPTVGAADFAFTGPEHIASVSTYQDENEIKNRIVIKGIREAEPVEREETKVSRLRDEASDADSIKVYGERTLTITNHLFQDLDSIGQMCAVLLVDYKDPKWYSTVKIPFNPVPLEIGDSMSWVERLSPDVNTATQTGLIRDIKIDNYNVTYKCER